MKAAPISAVCVAAFVAVAAQSLSAAIIGGTVTVRGKTRKVTVKNGRGTGDLAFDAK